MIKQIRLSLIIEEEFQGGELIKPDPKEIIKSYKGVMKFAEENFSEKNYKIVTEFLQEKSDPSYILEKIREKIKKSEGR